jgi:hypothetical protein
MVIALVVGIALNPLAARPSSATGHEFLRKTLLRLGGGAARPARRAWRYRGTWRRTAILSLSSQWRRRFASGFIFARWSGQAPGFGALVGVNLAVCGASATLATSTVVPRIRGQEGRYLCGGSGKRAGHAGDADLSTALHSARLRHAEHRRDAGCYDP